MTRGLRCWVARSMARVMASPTTEPMLPPIKEYSIALTITSMAGAVLLLGVQRSLDTTIEAVERTIADGIAQRIRRQLRARSKPFRKLVHLRRCGRNARATSEVPEEQLARVRITLLWQIPHRELARQPPHGSRVGLLEPGEQAEQRGLSGAVRPDQADATARRNDQRDVTQNELRCVMLRDVSCGESAARSLQKRTSSEGGTEECVSRLGPHRAARERRPRC